LDFFRGMNYFWARRKIFMNPLIRQTILLAGLLTGIFGMSARAQNLDQIGVTLLRTQTTNLDGSGIRVAQPEASAPAFEVNPAVVGQPASLFTYASAAGTTTNYPNSVGTESGHADSVAANFYGLTGSGVATNVAHVDNFDANYFVYTYVVSNLAVLNDSVVNQSLIFTETNGGHASVGEQQEIDSAYDDYAAQYGTLFVSGAGNGGSVNPSATCYNGIGVAAYGGSSSLGPTLDNGRCKPDITAPAGVTSYSTPQVSGAAAVLMQAALRGDGGSDTNSAFDMRTIKALLLNGAVKPANWTNLNSSPLDARYGAGVLNVFNSYKQLAGGKNNSSATNFILIGAAHPPIAATNLIAVTSGWNLETIFSTPTNDAVNHNFFNATNGFVAATLVWNRQLGKTNINDLDLFLYDCANSNLVACSTSRVDNVEHVFVPRLATGRYDLQALKNGGTNVVSDSETYALAFAFAPTQLSLARAGSNAVLTWPVYPAGFCVEAATNLAALTWSANNLSATLTGSTNILTLPATNAAQFFRLRQPNF
jgi:hypothetical protein